MDREKILEILRANYPRLAVRYGVKRLGLFGSYARGYANEESDIDLVVEFEHPIGFEFVELAEELEALLGKKVDILTPAGIQGIRIAQVAQDIMRSLVYV